MFCYKKKKREGGRKVLKPLPLQTDRETDNFPQGAHYYFPLFFKKNCSVMRQTESCLNNFRYAGNLRISSPAATGIYPINQSLENKRYRSRRRRKKGQHRTHIVFPLFFVLFHKSSSPLHTMEAHMYMHKASILK